MRSKAHLKRNPNIYFENRESYNEHGKYKSEKNSGVHLKNRVTVLG